MKILGGLKWLMLAAAVSSVLTACIVVPGGYRPARFEPHEIIVVHGR